MTHMHRLVHLSTFIVKIYVFTRWILTLGPTINQGVENKSFQKLHPLMKKSILYSLFSRLRDACRRGSRKTIKARGSESVQGIALSRNNMAATNANSHRL